MRALFPELHKRPPPARQSAQHLTTDASIPRSGRRARQAGRIQRSVITLLVVFGALSLAQYLTTGRISWPQDLLQGAGDSIEQTATSPDAGWRHVTDAVETMGAAREGDPVPPFDLSGRVVRIADGDTVSILDGDNAQHKIRLFGIDTPERDQAYGTRARKALAEMIANKNVGVVLIARDDYGRQVGTVYFDDTNINLAMVTGGHAWWYQYYAPHERKLAVAQQQAQDRGLGLWSDPDPVPPWDWRRQRR